MTRSRQLRIAFVLGRIGVGGAEMMLWKLLARMDSRSFQPVVIAAADDRDGMLDRFMASGIECRLLGVRSRIDALAMLRLVATLRELAPDLLQGWMYYGNVAATLAAPLSGRRHVPVLWGIRGTLVEKAYTNRLSALSIWLSGKLSSRPARIINNSLTSAMEHERRLGFPAASTRVLPNGFDTDEFRPSPEARASLRGALGLPQDALLIGLMARYHPMKDHANFLGAAGLLKCAQPNVHFVLAGEYMNSENNALTRLIGQNGLNCYVHLLGARNDMPIVTAALDVAVCSSSSGEGFSNAIGEAMSCGVPCVATDVGDSAAIVGDTGKVVPPRDAQALAEGMAQLIDMGEIRRRDLGTRARQRVLDRYSLQSVVSQYENLYREVHAEFGRAQRA